MHIGTSLPGLAISAAAVLCAIVNLLVGIRMRRFDAASALSRFAIAGVATAIAVLSSVTIIVPAVGYGLLCLALVGGSLFDLVREERARKRRIASLTPRPAAEPILTLWVAIAGASASMLSPYVILGEQRAAALLVAVCALVMAYIAWRIASSPVRLEGADIPAERLRDRAARSRQTGLSAVLAIGSIFVFVCFVDLPEALAVQRILILASFGVWAGLWIWVMLYWRHLNRLACSAP